MAWLRWVIVALALVSAGWMAFDGTRALIVGDYVRPQSGEYAGQLGPWTHIVSAVGLDPESTLMKSIFSIYGFAWLAVTAAFAVRRPWAWRAMMAGAAGSVWCLLPGTAVSFAILGLLWVPAVRAAYRASRLPEGGTP